MNQTISEQAQLNILNAICHLETKMAAAGAKARLFIFEKDEINVAIPSEAFQEVLGTAYELICAKAFSEIKKMLHEAKAAPLASLESKDKKHFCTNCGYDNSYHTCINGADSPKPGSISICYNCGQAGIFMKDMLVRKLSAEEMEEIKLQQPELWEYIMIAKKAVKNKMVYE